MSNLYAQETWVDKSRDCITGESGVYETFSEDRGTLYRAMQREYGRCMGKVYIDKKDGKTLAIGWVFLKRAKYEDTGEPYLQETWVTVHSGPEKRTVEYDYAPHD